MITILLGILKIIGIVILSLVALILVCLLILLLCPICYSAQGSYIDAKVNAAGRISFLGRLFRFDFRYDNQNNLWYQAKILFYTILSSEPRPVKKKKRKPRKSNNTAKSTTNRVIEKKASIEECESDTKESDTDSSAYKTEEKKEKTEKTHTNSSNTIQNKRPNKRKRTSLYGKLKEKLRTFTKNIKKCWKRLCSVKRKIRLLIKLKNAETTELAYKSLKKYIKTIVRHIRPRVLKGNFTFGFEDPSITGELLGVFSLFYPVYKNDIKIIPYFDRSILEAEFRLKGHIQIIVFAITAIRLYTNKYIKKTIERWNRIKGGK